jgi:hypothetical protein
MINRRFASFWAGQTISQVGDRISELALPPIAVVTLAATPTEVGVLTAAVWAPNLLCLLVGSWATGARTASGSSSPRTCCAHWCCSA